MYNIVYWIESLEKALNDGFGVNDYNMQNSYKKDEDILYRFDKLIAHRIKTPFFIGKNPLSFFFKREKEYDKKNQFIEYLIEIDHMYGYIKEMEEKFGKNDKVNDCYIKILKEYDVMTHKAGLVKVIIDKDLKTSLFSLIECIIKITSLYENQLYDSESLLGKDGNDKQIGEKKDEHIKENGQLD
jgi:hypothetical protein